MAKQLSNPSEERFQVFTFHGVGSDLLFYEKVDLKLQRAWDIQIDDPHPDSTRFPNHKMVYREPLDSGGQRYKMWFAAERESQDAYNWEINGDELVRTYIIRRDKYLQAPVGGGTVTGEFLYPPGGTVDGTFGSYGFVEDQVVPAPQELRNTYIVVRRRLIRPETIDLVYNDTFKRQMRITKTVVPVTTTTVTASTPGTTYELRDGNKFHKVRIKQELVFNEGESTYPLTLPSIPLAVDRRFPTRLDSVTLVVAWAYADSTTAALSYSEDYYFQFKQTDPRPGPYEALQTRFITDNPSAWKTANPLNICPNPVTESICSLYAWFNASTKGNSTSAAAKEWAVPSTIHGEVTVNTSITEGYPGGRSPFQTETLEATPGYAEFAALTSFKADYSVKELPLGLYEVSLITLNITDLYGDS